MTPYFAYGSNLDAADLAAFCESRAQTPVALRGETAWLPDHRPAYHYRSPARGAGALDVVPCRGAVAPGAVFDLDERALALIEDKEGAGDRYERREVIVIREGGATQRAFTFTVRGARRRNELVPPSAHYLEVVQRGYREFGHPPAHAASVARGSVPWVNGCFVYGTLMSGQCREHFLSESKVTPAVLRRATLHDLGDFPGLRLGGTGVVHGEHHEVPDIGTRLGALDEVEDFFGFDDLRQAKPLSMYERTLVRVEGALCWTYVHREEEVGPILQHGDWRRVRQAAQK